MALTKKIKRAWIDRIIQIRRVEEPALKAEVLTIGGKLGPGTHRSTDHPGTKIRVQLNRRSSGGYSTDWRGVAEALRARYHVPDEVWDSLQMKHRNFRYGGVITPGVTVSVQKDTVKNPKLAAA